MSIRSFPVELDIMILTLFFIKTLSKRVIPRYTGKIIPRINYKLKIGAIMIAKNGKSSLPTVVSIALLSSCLMLGITGAYRLTAGENRKTEKSNPADTVTAEETDG